MGKSSSKEMSSKEMKLIPNPMRFTQAADEKVKQGIIYYKGYNLVYSKIRRDNSTPETFTFTIIERNITEATFQLKEDFSSGDLQIKSGIKYSRGRKANAINLFLDCEGEGMIGDVKYNIKKVRENIFITDLKLIY